MIASGIWMAIGIWALIVFIFTLMLWVACEDLGIPEQEQLIAPDDGNGDEGLSKSESMD